MSLVFNGVTVTEVYFNGVKLSELYMNGTKVFSAGITVNSGYKVASPGDFETRVWGYSTSAQFPSINVGSISPNREPTTGAVIMDLLYYVNMVYSSVDRSVILVRLQGNYNGRQMKLDDIGTTLQGVYYSSGNHTEFVVVQNGSEITGTWYPIRQKLQSGGVINVRLI